jgi:pimeloyl-ACP methyl ester carboxylesterase
LPRITQTNTDFSILLHEICNESFFDMNNPTKTEPVHYVQQGTGTPVILIHGLAASLFDWNDLLPALAGADYAAYALDLLGHGQSLKPDNLDAYTVENVFAHFSTWVDSLQLDEPLILVGHSLGGYLSIRYALRHSERVRALVLTDPFYTLNQLPFYLRLYYRHPIVNPAIVTHLPEWLIRSVVDLTSLSIRNGYVLPKNARSQTAADYKRVHPGIFSLLHTAQDLTPYLSSVSQPTLVLWGERDQTLAPTLFQKILNEIPNASGSGIPGAGHVPHQSHPVEFNRRVLEFLRTVDGRP